ncbi:hypothetical protein QC762_0004570 [Podospora pseudocomata]|uniref:Uncharacterized protein n=1 Tax=Podospora pseudocomata TaxID=2093779 RepID=A0ABR0GTE3_9PEZI|nr:hypothetical protein QC762_0004570 [Podospora pseudocomata]
MDLYLEASLEKNRDFYLLILKAIYLSSIHSTSWSLCKARISRPRHDHLVTVDRPNLICA